MEDPPHNTRLTRKAFLTIIKVVISLYNQVKTGSLEKGKYPVEK